MKLKNYQYFEETNWMKCNELSLLYDRVGRKYFKQWELGWGHSQFQSKEDYALHSWNHNFNVAYANLTKTDQK